MDYDPEYLARLKAELERATKPGFYNTYKDANGKVFTGGGEGHVKKHLTSGSDYVDGRQFRFPGLANGWEFEPALRAAGFKIIKGYNYRNQFVSVVVSKDCDAVWARY